MVKWNLCLPMLACLLGIVSLAMGLEANACLAIEDPHATKEEHRYRNYDHGFDALIARQLYQISFGPIKWGPTDDYELQVTEVWRGGIEVGEGLLVHLPKDHCSLANAVVGAEFRFFAKGEVPFDALVLKAIDPNDE